MTNTIKQDYTFSGQDIKVFAYRNLAVEKERQKRRATSNSAQGKSAQQLYNEGLSEANYTQSAQKPSERQGRSQARGAGDSSSISEVEAKLGDSTNLGRNDSGISGRNGDNVFFELGTLDTFSYSTFREKNAIRTLGRSHAIGYTRGPRTVAGSLVFNATQENELLKFFAGVDINDSTYANIPIKSVMLDQVDPFNIILVFSNEMGGNSVLQLFNVDLSSESQRMSVHDLIIQNSVNFYATDILPMQDVGNTFSNRYEMLFGLASGNTGSTKKDIRSEISANINKRTLGAEAQDLLSRSRGLF